MLDEKIIASKKVYVYIYICIYNNYIKNELQKSKKNANINFFSSKTHFSDYIFTVFLDREAVYAQSYLSE